MGFGVFWFLNRSDEVVVINNDGINYDPPTETEITETNQHKNDLAEKINEDGTNQEQPDVNLNDSKRGVTPIISFSGQSSAGSDLELNGYVPGVVEKNGKCTARLTKGNKTVEETKVALDDAQSTSCGLIVIPRNELSAGNWSLLLIYNSPSSTGSSETVTVTIE